jgi:chain length determinant protein tyrosine kinase EpsG
MSTSKKYVAANVMALAEEPADRRLGALLREAGKLTDEQIENVLRAQHESHRRFGEAAIKLGYVGEADVRQMLARQFEYSYLEPGDSNISTEIVAAYEPFSRRVEALRALRSQLKMRWFDRAAGGRALAIISPHAGDGRSYLAANLAVVFAQLGERTLLIDADMRRPRQHQLFGVNEAPGLSTMLSGRDQLGAVQRVALLDDLWLLPAGPPPPNPVELLERPAFTKLLDQFREEYDVVLVDTAAGTIHADAHTAAVRCEAALIVVRKNATRLADVKKLAGVVQTAEIVGTVLNES